MKRVAVLVSGGGSNLQALLEAEKNGEIPSCKISLVISSKEDAYALERAKKAGVPAVVVARKNHVNFDKALLYVLRKNKIDVVVLAGFLSILGEEMLSAYPNKIINVHPSLIPSFCGDGFYGLKVHEAALTRGVKLTGATVHIVNNVTDGGEILFQKAVDVMPQDTAKSLQLRVMQQAEWLILPKGLEMLCAKF